MPDRPAAELLAEWHASISSTGQCLLYEHVLERLARAERVLADVHAACDTYGGYPIITLERVRAALRAEVSDKAYAEGYRGPPLDRGGQ